MSRQRLLEAMGILLAAMLSMLEQLPRLIPG